MRGLTGIALGGIQAVAMALLVEVLPRHRVPAAAAVYITGNTIGGVAGRLIAGPVSELLHWRIGLLVVAALGVVACVLFFVLLPRGLEERVARPMTFAESLANVGHHLSRWQTASIYVQGFLVMGSFTAVYNYLGFHLTGEPFSIPAALASLFFLVYFVARRRPRRRAAGHPHPPVVRRRVRRLVRRDLGAADARPGVLDAARRHHRADDRHVHGAPDVEHAVGHGGGSWSGAVDRAVPAELADRRCAVGMVRRVLYDRFGWSGVVGMSTVLAIGAMGVAASRAWVTRMGFSGEERTA